MSSKLTVLCPVSTPPMLKPKFPPQNSSQSSSQPLEDREAGSSALHFARVDMVAASPACSTQSITFLEAEGLKGRRAEGLKGVGESEGRATLGSAKRLGCRRLGLAEMGQGGPSGPTGFHSTPEPKNHKNLEP